MKKESFITQASIAVVVPFYNGEKYWADLVDSLECQTSKLDEAVIVLDGDQQCLPEIDLDGIARCVKIVKLNQNRGVASARNAGIDAVESDYILFLDQDDFYYPSRIAEIRTCISSTNSDWIVNSYKIVRKDGFVIKAIKPRRWVQSPCKQKRLKNHFLLKKGGPKISTICCKKQVIKRFDPNMGSCDDFVFIFELLEINSPIRLALYGNARRYHDSNNSQSSKHRKSQIKAIASMYRKYNFSIAVRRRCLSTVCCNLAMESMLYHSKERAVPNFLRAFRLNKLNFKAIIALSFCKLSKDPVTTLNRIKGFLKFFHLSKSQQIVGS
jgi:glycosyltransferase involved in cell wall biosynthesis